MSSVEVAAGEDRVGFAPGFAEVVGLWPAASEDRFLAALPLEKGGGGGNDEAENIAGEEEE